MWASVHVTVLEAVMGKGRNVHHASVQHASMQHWYCLPLTTNYRHISRGDSPEKLIIRLLQVGCRYFLPDIVAWWRWEVFHEI